VSAETPSGTGAICFAMLRCERAGKPSTYTHVRLGRPTARAWQFELRALARARAELIWLATCPSAGCVDESDGAWQDTFMQPIRAHAHGRSVVAAELGGSP